FFRTRSAWRGKARSLCGVCSATTWSTSRSRRATHTCMQSTWMTLIRGGNRGFIVLEYMTDASFPGLVSKRTECAICGNNIDSESGRMSHATLHILHNLVPCPLQCGFETKEHHGIHRHLKQEHGLEGGRKDQRIAGKKYASFHSRWEQYHEKVKWMVKMLFPLPLPDAKFLGANKLTAEEAEETVAAHLSGLWKTPPIPPPVSTVKRPESHENTGVNQPSLVSTLKRFRSESPEDCEVKQVPKKKKKKK
ncbi:hypothetical protein PFISCL1PPCAC_25699, partial [Pristionchus fissidentatus]